MHATSTPTLAQPKPNAFGAFVASAALVVGIAAGAIAAVNLAPAAGTALSNPAITTGAGLSIQRNGETGALSAAQRSLQTQRQGEIGAGAAAAAPAVQPTDVMARFNGLGLSVTPAVPALGGRDGTAYWNTYSLSGISSHDALRGSLGWYAFAPAATGAGSGISAHDLLRGSIGWYAFEPAASAGNTQAAATTHRSHLDVPGGTDAGATAGASACVPRLTLYSAAMQYAESILDLVGHTPLVRITRVLRDLAPLDRQPLVLAKLEMLNPGGSVKDRIGLPMIEAAERAGLLKPGGTIIEPTSGNTGHGLAIAAALKGYRCIFVMADKQSVEKQALLRAYGAEVVLCPTNVSPESPESYYSVAARLARDIPGAFKPDQYWNMENPAAHERTTGPELWDQTEGRITHFVASVGTGGTISGTAHVLKARNPTIQVIGADPEGSILSGDTARPYLTEGVGEDFLPGTHDPSVVDRWVRVGDRDAFAMARRLTREEGILSGGSCGTAMVATREVVRDILARDGGQEAVVVVLLPDSGRSYLSKIYNDEWMRANGLMATTGSATRIDALLADRHHGPDMPSVIVARTTERVGDAIARLQQFGISQLPVSEEAEGDDIVGLVGSISEKGLLDRAYRDPTVVERTVGEVMDHPLPLVAASATLDEAFALLTGGANALVAVRGERPAGVVTKLDILEYLAHRPSSSS